MDDEARTAIDVYDQASKRRPSAAAARYEGSGRTSLPVATLPIGDSDDEGTSTAKEDNGRRREEASIRKLESKNRRRDQENELRIAVGQKIIGFVATQLALTNMLAWLYALVMLARNNPIPSEVIIAWLSSTIVEIIGLLWVVARSLFPFRDKHRDGDAERKGK